MKNTLDQWMDLNDENDETRRLLSWELDEPVALQPKLIAAALRVSSASLHQVVKLSPVQGWPRSASNLDCAFVQSISRVCVAQQRAR